MIKRITSLTFALSWMIAIFLFSAQTAESSGADSMFFTEKILRLFTDNPSEQLLHITEVVFRKLCHFAEYGLLAILWYMVFRSFNVSSKRMWISIVICVIYAISDEIHQHFVPGRACRFYDICIDSLGCAAGYACCFFFEHIKKKKLSKV